MKKKIKISFFIIFVILITISLPRLHKIIFGYDVLLSEINQIKKEIKNVKQSVKQPITGEVFYNKLLTSKKGINKYYLEKFYLPFDHYYKNGLKPVGYLELTEDKIIFVTGIGESFYFDIKDLSYKKINFKKIPNNLKNIINDPLFFGKNGSYSIKDMIIIDDYLYISYTKLVKQLHCYNTSILKSKLNLNKLFFEEFFTYNDCIDKLQTKEYLAHLAGGRFANYKNKILFSIGEYQQRSLAQDDKVLFGKIILIDTKTKEYEVISKGHRNPQGLLYLVDKEVILSTEHGPEGGDEINKIEKGENYGWPIASYGQLPPGNYINGRKDPKPYKSHKKHGFIEPLRYFIPSVGISQLAYVPKEFNNKSNNVFVASMGRKKSVSYVYKAIFDIEFDVEFTEIKSEDVIVIGERIRDIIYIPAQNVFVMTLETSPSIGLLKNNN